MALSRGRPPIRRLAVLVLSLCAAAFMVASAVMFLLSEDGRAYNGWSIEHMILYLGSSMALFAALLIGTFAGDIWMKRRKQKADDQPRPGRG